MRNTQPSQAGRTSGRGMPNIGSLSLGRAKAPRRMWSTSPLKSLSKGSAWAKPPPMRSEYSLLSMKELERCSHVLGDKIRERWKRSCGKLDTHSVSERVQKLKEKGLLTRKQHAAMLLLRDARNIFAHQGDSDSFTKYRENKRFDAGNKQSQRITYKSVNKALSDLSVNKSKVFA